MIRTDVRASDEHGSGTDSRRRRVKHQVIGEL